MYRCDYVASVRTCGPFPAVSSSAVEENSAEKSCLYAYDSKWIRTVLCLRDSVEKSCLYAYDTKWTRTVLYL